MASLIAAQTGNFTSASTWQVVDSNGEIDSEAGTVAISTSNIDSPTFTPGAITVDAIALKMSARIASPTGTISITLRNSTDATDVETVTLNVSDLPVPVTSAPEWVCVKLATSHLLIAAKAYIVRVVCSNTGSQVTLFRSTSGSNNFSKKIRTTTTAAPGSGDHMIISKQYTGAGTSTAVTVTLDNTATTSFGPTVSGGPPQGMVISGAGVLTVGTTGSTAYYLKIKGILLVAGSGTFNCGANGAEMPASSSFTLMYDCVATADSGMIIAGTINFFGAPKTAWTRLTADAAAAATTISVADNTGWAAADDLGFAATGANFTDSEKKVINNPATVTLTAGLTNAHSGTSPRAGEVANLTRNILLTGVDATHRGWHLFLSSASGTMRHFKALHCGVNTTNRRCLDVQTTAASSNLVLEDWVVTDVGNNLSNPLLTSGAACDKFYVRRGVMYQCNIGLTVGATSGVAWEVSDCLYIGVSGNSDAAAFTFTDCAGAIKGNVAVSVIADLGAMIFVDTSPIVFDATNHAGNIAHNCTGTGIVVGSTNAAQFGGVISGWKSFLNGRPGLQVASCAPGLTIDNPSFWGNGGANGGNLDFTGPVQTITVLDGFIAGSSVRASPLGVSFAGGTAGCFQRITFRNTTFGVATGILVGHSTADLGYNNAGTFQTQAVLLIEFENCLFSSTTWLNSGFLTNQIGDESKLGSQKHQQTEDSHRFQRRSGLGTLDATIFQTAAPSLRMAPNSASVKMFSNNFRKPCDDGGSVTIDVAVRKSAAGDGAAYNGNAPRLMLRANAAVGIAADQVVDTHSVSAGSWETLTGTIAGLTDDGVLEFYVDCDGTAGWINVDDWL